MSLVNDCVAIYQGVQGRLRGNENVFKGRGELLRGPDTPSGSPQDIVQNENKAVQQIHLGNMFAKCSQLIEETASNKQDKDFNKGLSGFDVFA